MNEATPPKRPPIASEPSASGMGLWKYMVKAIQVAAIPTPATAAVSSSITTFKDGSRPRKTETKIEFKVDNRFLS